MIKIVKEKYLKLIQQLRKNARIPLSSISKLSGTPISTLHDRLKLTEKNYITKYTSLINYQKLGYSLRAKILICSNAIEKWKEFIKLNNNINSAYNLQGDYDFLIECIFKDVSEFNNFMNDLSLMPVLSKQVYFINEDIKKEAFLA